MPLDKDVFVVSLGRRNDILTRSRNGTVVSIAGFKHHEETAKALPRRPDLRHCGIENHDMGVRSIRGAPNFGLAKIQVVGALGPTKIKKGNRFPFLKLCSLDKRMQRLYRGLPVLHR
jgi:hypothetical protein